MILAAGFGTRLQELTLGQPKPLIKIKNHYLIDYALYLIRKAGIRDVIINTHYHADKIQNTHRNGSKYGLHISYSHEQTILGTGGGLKNAESFFNDQPFVLINSDIICDIDVRKVINFHRHHKASATMVLRKDNTLPNFDEIKLTRDHKILSINHIPEVPSTTQTENRMFTGIHVLEPIVFSYLKPAFSSIISDFYQIALNDKLRIMGYDFGGFWMDAGSKENLDKARQEAHLPSIDF